MFKPNITTDPASLSWHQALDELKLMIEAEGAQAAVKFRSNIESTLIRYISNEKDFAPYIHFDESGYTKNLVEEIGGQCNIIVMCWAPGQSSALHSHEGSKCFVKVLKGQLSEHLVQYPSKGLAEVSCKEKQLNRDGVFYIDDSVGLHKMTNRSSEEPAITLHTYLPAYKRCRIFETTITTTSSTTNYKGLSLDKSSSIDVTFSNLQTTA